jgi:NAD(P)-dependent dehydrogenase (short-subunit alcohol dehydrogenase family)
MIDSNDTITTALVTGASRGFGRAIAAALHADGARVVAVARSGDRLAALHDELGDRLVPVVADITDPVVAGALMTQYRPDTLVLNAGAAPLPRPLQEQTWETFSRNWDVDVRHTFHWLREALLQPLHPGSTVVVMSSGAALFGSPLSGGYAGAKSTIRFITGYAADESARAGLGIRFVSVLPKLTPATDLGATAAEAYARRNDMTVEQYLEEVGPGITPEDVGKATIDLVSAAEHDAGAFLLTPAGLSPLQ